MSSQSRNRTKADWMKSLRPRMRDVAMIPKDMGTIAIEGVNRVGNDTPLLQDLGAGN